jgi:hypothetical protein
MKARKTCDTRMLNRKAFENYFITNIIYFQSFKLFHYEKVDCLKQFNVDLIGSDRLHKKTLFFKTSY